MPSQRASAVAVLVIVVLFFTWEKSKLQQQASDLVHLRNQHQAVRDVTTSRRVHARRGPLPPHHVEPTTDIHGGHVDDAESPETRSSPSSAPQKREVHVAGDGVPPSTAAPHDGGDGLAPLQYAIVANASSSCPLPALHPGKFQAKMGWGIRKTFPPCIPEGKRTFATIAVGSNGRAEVTIDRDNCSGGASVWAFGELKDSDFKRLSSTFDAEIRQNELKERFSDVHSFATKVSASEDSTYSLPKGSPYAVAECNGFRQLLITAPKAKRGTAKAAPPEGAIKNVLHVMIDSTSIYAFRRSAKRLVSWLEHVDSGNVARVHAMKHYHAVSCCSPGNQIPMYSGNMNGEGDHFVRSEPKASSKDWLWNIAQKLGFTTYWSLDNCPDKSARDYHAYPSVDSRVVAPICLAGVLLSHKEATCVGGKFVSSHVLDGLESFWKQHPGDRKFAAVQLITPHEETEKLLMEVDDILSAFFARLERWGTLNDTAIVFWSDHGINFGKYASTHDGEIEKMFPFVNVILPRWVDKSVHRSLRAASDRLTTPYDMYEVARSLLHYPLKSPAFSHDPANPKLPRPEDSHIMASFQKKIDPVDLTSVTMETDRACYDANIPMEFCTCIPWKETEDDKYNKFGDLAIKEHRALLANYTSASGPCEEVRQGSVVSTFVQLWPEEYKPKGKTTSKKIWMQPNRDVVRVHYETAAGPGHALFTATFSVEKATGKAELILIDRLDAMQKKCGLTDKVQEQMCVCK